MNWDLFFRRRAEALLGIYSFFCLVALIKRWDLWVRAVKALIFYLLIPSALTLSQLVSYGVHLGPRIPALANAFQESQVLKEQLRHHALLQIEASELRAENERLREILHFDKKSFPDYLVCEIVARDPGNWFASVLVNRGEADGVRAGFPVVAYAEGHIGLTGSVEEVSRRSAKVLLISDPLSSVSVSIGSQKELAVLQGQGSNELLLTFIVPQAEIKDGDEIITAGLGQAYPEGIPIGSVIDVEPPSSLSFRKAYVRTFFPLSRLKELMILTTKKEGS